MKKEIKPRTPNPPGNKSQSPEDILEKVKSLRTAGYLPIARQIAEQAGASQPQNLPLKRERMMIRLAMEDYAGAEELLEDLIKHSPDNAVLHTTLARTRFHQRNVPGELSALTRSLQLKFDPSVAARLFTLQRDSGDTKSALATVRVIQKHNPHEDNDVAELRLMIGAGQRDEAIAKAKILLEQPNTPKPVVDIWLQHMLQDLNDPDVAIDVLKKLLKKRPDEPALHAALGRSLHRAERDEEAIRHLKTAIDTSPAEERQWYYDLALIQRQSGQIEEAQGSLEKILQKDHLDPTVLRVFGAEHKYRWGDPQFNRVNLALVSEDEFPKQKQVELHFAAAKAFEDVGDLPTAFAHYALAGKKQNEITPYKAAAADGLLKTLRRGFTPRTYEPVMPDGYASSLPTFVLGMPRSGTTLTEQILASHNETYGAGELKLLHRVLDGINVNGNLIRTSTDTGKMPSYIPHVDLTCSTMNMHDRGKKYVEAINAILKSHNVTGKTRVVDKMPGNYYWVGLIPFILPQARVIHTKRHPADTCISNYRIFFPDGMPWTYNLKSLGKAYRSYYEHMKHWESNLPPGFMLSVYYEDMVVDLEKWARKIISHIGLEWDENCLKFHETERSVKTASLNQVRKPLYTTSVGRWKKYEPYIQPLLREIQPIIDEYESDLAAIQKLK